MRSAGRRFRFAFVCLIAFVVSALVWSISESCSCVYHARNEIVPPPGAVDVPRNVTIRFTAIGTGATAVEKRLVGEYVLRRVEADDSTAIIETEQQLVGTRMVIKPHLDLSPQTEYVLTIQTETGIKKVTEFITAAEPLIPRLRKALEVTQKLNTAPELENIAGFAERSDSPACQGHTRGYSITVKVPVETILDPDNYDWVVEDSNPQGTLVTTQRIAIQNPRINASWGERWQEYKLVIGHSQCGAGPEPESGEHVVVLSLVGLGETAWSSDQTRITVP